MKVLKCIIHKIITITFWKSIPTFTLENLVNENWVEKSKGRDILTRLFLFIFVAKEKQWNKTK